MPKGGDYVNSLEDSDGRISLAKIHPVAKPPIWAKKATPPPSVFSTVLDKKL